MTACSSFFIAACFTLGLAANPVPELKHHTARWCASCERDGRGRIRRNSAARREFRNAHPCPGTGYTSGPCAGFVIDHIQALKHGGADTAENMQWQSAAAAKAKDRVE
jgi:hypothetical protein